MILHPAPNERRIAPRHGRDRHRGEQSVANADNLREVGNFCREYIEIADHPSQSLVPLDGES